MDLKKLMGNLVISGLFIFAIISFIIIIQSENNEVVIPLMNNSLFNETYSDLYGNLTDSKDSSQKASDDFGTITPNQKFGIVQVISIFSSTKIFKTIGLGFYNIIVKLPVEFLGVSPIVASVISTIILLLFIIGIWAVWKGAITS